MRLDWNLAALHTPNRAGKRERESQGSTTQKTLRRPEAIAWRLLGDCAQVLGLGFCCGGERDSGGTGSATALSQA